MSGCGGIVYDRYAQAGRNEWLTRIGPADGPPILIVPPLFEELNRTRALLVAVMRRLAAEGHACVLPDLPGTGESERGLADCGWQDWVSAITHVAESLGSGLLVVAIRGGALLDDVPARAHWRLAPAEGAALARDLARAGLVGGSEGAGYDPAAALIAHLETASPQPRPRLRTARLASDPKPADVKLDGPALWRRSEPATASELADAIASDLIDWSRACAAS